MRRPVKSRAFPATARTAREPRSRDSRQRFRRVLSVVATLGGSFSLAARASVSDAQPLLQGVGPSGQKTAAPLDPSLPTGPEMTFESRPTDRRAAACSFVAPVCVHSAAGVTNDFEGAFLAALERAYERLVWVLRLPAPLPDDARGGGPSFDVYLSPGSEPRYVAMDARDIAVSHDAATAFCVDGADGALADRDATSCLAEAISFRLDASETPFSRRALAAELWNVTGDPTSADARAIDDYQASPERATVARDLSKQSEGSSLFLDYLDREKGLGDPGSVPIAAFALSGHGRSPDGFRWVNEPDTLDVLRTTFGPTPTDVARLFSSFSVARAFVGTRDAEGLWPSADWAGDFARVRFEWSVPFSSLPRSLAPSRPVEPTGSTYLYVSFDTNPSGASFVFQADWEPPVAFAWALALVGKNGAVTRRIDVPFLERGTHVERTVGDLAGAAGILIAGTNLGGLGPSYPFDPDFEPFEPHSYSVYVGKQ